MFLASETLDWARDGADWPNREASRFVKAAGLRWHVQEAGEGPCVLLLHGVGGATHSWRDLLPLLARDHRVIAPDLPGHGFSERGRTAAMTPETLAEGLGALMAEMGARPELIAGHSAGAAVAARMALDGRAAPRAIVAFNGAFLPFEGAAGRLFPLAAKLLALNPLVPRAFAWTVDRRAAERLLANTGSGLDPVGRELYRRCFASPAHASAALSMMASWRLEELAADLARLPCHLELIAGEADRAVPPRQAEAVAKRVPRAHVSRLPGLGHLAHEERPETAAEIVRRVEAETAG